MYSGILKSGSKYLLKKAKQSGIKSSARKMNENVNDFAEDWLDIGSLNDGEEERLNERDNQVNSIKKDISEWDERDLDRVMKSREYQYDKVIQEKVQKYFERKYPGNQRLDATGRPI